MWLRSCTVLALAIVTAAGWAQSPNAWKIDDGSNVSGSTLAYHAKLTDTEVQDAFAKGWRLTVTARLTYKYGAGADTEAMYFIVGSGTERYGFSLWLTGFLYATSLTGEAVPLTETGVTNYHRHTLEYNPKSLRVKYWFDDLLVAEWLGQTSSAQSHQVSWGSSASATKSELNVHQVWFEILGEGKVASYNAGFEGKPAVAPSPVSQGWTRGGGLRAISDGPVSPDMGSLPFVTALPPGRLQRTSASVRAYLQPDGLPMTYYFEYGTTPAYGTQSAVTSVPEGVFSLSASNLLTGLVPGTGYHYRAVVSNAIGQAVSEDVAFTLPEFVPVSGTVFPADLLPNTVVWGDFDADGWLDLLLGGDPASHISGATSGLWRNNRNGTFSDVTSRLAPSMPVRSNEAAWGDYDNDGLLDFVITGQNASELLHQDPDRTFSAAAGFTGLGLRLLTESSLAWGDSDNDGRLDLLEVGNRRFDGPSSQVWRNTRGGFTALAVPDLSALGGGAGAWADYDNDGRLDLLVTGATNGSGSGQVSQIWHNDGAGTFSEVTARVAPGLPGVSGGSVAWGDYDNDGRLDFLLLGLPKNGESPPRPAQIWHNNGGTFLNVTASAAPDLPLLRSGSVAWGDYDNDGRLDFLIAGWVEYDSGVSQLWHNNGDGTFSNVTGTAADLPQPVGEGFWWPQVAWADFDQDGRLDFMIAGYASSLVTGYQTSYGLWRNEGDRTNTLPTAPSNLSAAVSPQRVLLSWAPATDAQTPAAGLSYNVRVGTSPGAGDVLSAQARDDGRRLLSVLGNAQMRTNLLVENLAPGTYYWSVQAVDTALAGGPFAPERTFTAGEGPLGRPQLIDLLWLGDGLFRFSFEGTPAGIFTVLSTTNLGLPLNTWTTLGTPRETSPGHFAFTNQAPANLPARYFQVRSP